MITEKPKPFRKSSSPIKELGYYLLKKQFPQLQLSLDYWFDSEFFDSDSPLADHYKIYIYNYDFTQLMIHERRVATIQYDSNEPGLTFEKSVASQSYDNVTYSKRHINNIGEAIEIIKNEIINEID